MGVSLTLRSIPFFRELPPEAIEHISRAGRVEQVPAGAIVCREGGVSRNMYAVLEGTVRVYKQDEDGDELELNRLGAGSYFGELALLDGAPRSASVQTVTECSLYVLEQRAFLDALEAHPRLLSGVVLALTARMRDR